MEAEPWMSAEAKNCCSTTTDSRKLTFGVRGSGHSALAEADTRHQWKRTLFNAGGSKLDVGGSLDSMPMEAEFYSVHGVNGRRCLR